jgi:ornithine cyclodeaminase
MSLSIIDASAVRDLLPVADCIAAMELAAKAVTEGTIVVPQRIIMPLADRSGFLVVMPGSAAEPPMYGTKLVSLHPANPAAGRPAVQGLVVLFDHHTGAPLALIDGAEITALRTSAASALATRLLALPEARTLGILGCGVQASAHLRAIPAVRPIEEIKVWGRSFDKARAFAAQHAPMTNAKVSAVPEPSEAAACDVVCVVSGAHEPVIFGRWVRPGAHVNLVGAHTATTREADTALIAASRVYVDSLEAAFNEAGDLLIPLAEGAIERQHVVGEIGALLLGHIPGRTDAGQITVYKSLGHFSQDLYAAHAVHERHSAARARRD